MKNYNLCFVFNSDLTKVLLIHKNRPEWMNGLINGLGGKIEDGEDTLLSVIREVKEESNLNLDKDSLMLITDVNSLDFTMKVYACAYKGNIDDSKSLEDEEVEWFNVDNLPHNVIPNLFWMIPLSIDMLKNKRIKNCLVEYYPR